MYSNLDIFLFFFSFFTINLQTKKQKATPYSANLYEVKVKMRLWNLNVVQYMTNNTIRN